MFEPNYGSLGRAWWGRSAAVEKKSVLNCRCLPLSAAAQLSWSPVRTREFPIPPGEVSRKFIEALREHRHLAPGLILVWLELPIVLTRRAPHAA